MNHTFPNMNPSFQSCPKLDEIILNPIQSNIGENHILTLTNTLTTEPPTNTNDNDTTPIGKIPTTPPPLKNR